MVPRYFSFSINFSTVYISCTLKEQKDAAIYILYICKKKRQQKCFFFYLTLDSHVNIFEIPFFFYRIRNDDTPPLPPAYFHFCSNISLISTFNTKLSTTYSQRPRVSNDFFFGMRGGAMCFPFVFRSFLILFLGHTCI